MNETDPNTDGAVRVILADNRRWVRSAVRLLLEQRADISIAAEASSAEEVVEQCRATCPDILLVDWELFGERLRELLPSITRHCSAPAIVVLSGRTEVEGLAMKAGADYFVSKGDPPEQLLAVLGKCIDARNSRGRTTR